MAAASHRGGRSEREDVDHRAIPVGRKTLHVDVGRSGIGPYLKLATVGDRGRDTVIIPGTGVAEFSEALDQLTRDEATLPGVGASARESSEPLCSARVRSDGKTFFLDVRENDAGRYVKISELRPGADRSVVTFDSTALGAVSATIVGMNTRHAKMFAEAEDSTAMVADRRRAIRLAKGSNDFGEFIALTEIIGGGRAGKPRTEGARMVVSMDLARKLHAALGRIIA